MTTCCLHVPFLAATASDISTHFMVPPFSSICLFFKITFPFKITVNWSSFGDRNKAKTESVVMVH